MLAWGTPFSPCEWTDWHSLPLSVWVSLLERWQCWVWDSCRMLGPPIPLPVNACLSQWSPGFSSLLFYILTVSFCFHCGWIYWASLYSGLMLFIILGKLQPLKILSSPFLSSLFRSPIAPGSPVVSWQCPTFLSFLDTDMAPRERLVLGSPPALLSTSHFLQIPICDTLKWSCQV